MSAKWTSPADGLEGLEPRAYLAAGAGLLDTTFGTGGTALAPILTDNHDSADAVALQRDGKVVVSGWTDARGGPETVEGLLVARFNVDGMPDATFGPGGDGQVVVPAMRPAGLLRPAGLAIQRDGKIVVAHETFEGVRFYRFNPDGSADTTFGAGETGRADVAIDAAVGGSWSQVNTLAVRPDGRLLAGGVRAGQSQDFLLVQVTADGTPDATFGAGGVAVLGTRRRDDEVRALAVLADGSVLAVGRARDDVAVARVTARGRLDPTFGPDGTGIARVDAGSADETAAGVTVRADGRILIGGSSGRDLVLARLTAVGTLDRSFGPGTTGVVKVDLGAGEEAAGLVGLRDGRLVLFGTTGTYGADSRFAAVRFDADGRRDGGYGTGGVAAVDFGPRDDRAVGGAVYKDGRLVLAGGVSNVPGVDVKLARLTAGGAVDATFSGDGRVVINRQSPGSGAVEDTARAPDGKLYVVGTADAGEEHGVPYVRRFHTNGSPDPTFGDQGVVRLTNWPWVGPMRLAVPDGGERLVLAVEVNEGDLMRPRPWLYLVRLNADGSRDGAFGVDGVLRAGGFSGSPGAVAVDRAGRIVVAGQGAGGWYVTRYDLDGSADRSFGVAGTVVTGLAGLDAGSAVGAWVGSDGRILVAGSAFDHGFAPGAGAFLAARYLPDGRLDPSYGAGGTAVVRFGAGDTYDRANAAVLLPDGSLAVGGQSATEAVARLAVARLTPAGALDPTFGEGGRVLTNASPDARPEPTRFDDTVTALAVLSDGSVVARATSRSGNETGGYHQRQFLVRYTGVGAPDAAFGLGGLLDEVEVGGAAFGAGLEAQAGGKVVTVGTVVGAVALARYAGRPGAAPAVTFAVVDGTLVITGTPGDDTIRLARGMDGEPLLDLSGVDGIAGPRGFSRIVIRGLGGDDEIDVRALGFEGPMIGGPFRVPATLDGGAGRDTLYGGNWHDVLHGGPGADWLDGGAGHDTLFGHLGEDVLRGGDGNDYLNGGPGADRVFGDGGNDQIFAVDGTADKLDGGAGFDRVKRDVNDLLTNAEGVLA